MKTKIKVSVSISNRSDDCIPLEELVFKYKSALSELASLRIKLDRLIRAESRFSLRGKQNYRLKYEQLSIRHKELLAAYAKAIAKSDT